MKKYILILSAILIYCSTTQAQQSYQRYRKANSNYGPKAIGLNVGYYSPSLDYFKDRTGFDFKGGLIFGASGEYWISKPLSVRIGASYFSTSADSKLTDTFTEKTTL